MSKFIELVKDRAELTSFAYFLMRHHAEELLEFWIAVELYRSMLYSAEQILSGRLIYDSYIAWGASREVNLPETVKNRVIEAMRTFAVTSSTFDESQTVILNFIELDSIPRYNFERSTAKRATGKKLPSLEKTIEGYYSAQQESPGTKKNTVLRRLGRVFSPSLLRSAGRSTTPPGSPDLESTTISSNVHDSPTMSSSPPTSLSNSLFVRAGISPPVRRRNSKPILMRLRRDPERGSKENLMSPERPKEPAGLMDVKRDSEHLINEPPPMLGRPSSPNQPRRLLKKDRSFSDPVIFEDFQGRKGQRSRFDLH